MNGSVSVSVNIINRHASRNRSLDPRELTCERHVPPPTPGDFCGPAARAPPSPAPSLLHPSPGPLHPTRGSLHPAPGSWRLSATS